MKASAHSNRSGNSAGSGPKFVYHVSFEEPGAEQLFVGDNCEVQEDFTTGYMPDEVTRATAKRMHYMAWRMHQSSSTREWKQWQQRYFAMRDAVVLGNRKLVYRAVSRRMAASPVADDMIGDCHIVLIQAVAAYNPWLGIRFSTYAFTCLMRALSRLSHRHAADWLARSLSLDALPLGEPRDHETAKASSGSLRLEEYLQEGNDLLSHREKMVLRRRFCMADTQRTGTLEQVGRELGLSKERVRQVQATALGKLRKALLEEAPAS